MLKLSEAIHGDYRKTEVRESIQAYLRKIPVIEKYEKECEEITIDLLEKVMWKLGDKYGITLQYIMPAFQKEGAHYYTASFKTKEGHKWIGTVHGISIYEIFAKGVLMCYSFTRKVDKNIH